MNQTSKVQLGDKNVELPIVVGSENEHALDISSLRADTGYITLDNGYGNTGSCKSAVTYIDGEKGILRYRGIPIEQLAEQSTFIETALLLIYGELPTQQRLDSFRAQLTEHQLLHEGLRHVFHGLPANGHPMAILSSMINAVSCYHPDAMDMEDEKTFESAAARLLAKVRTIAAASFRTSTGKPIIYPSPRLSYTENFLHMMFSLPYADYEMDQDVVKALQLFLILHADHEQNCSTSTVRMVASSGANLFASCSAGVCALWGWKHGGANVAVIKMLQQIHDEGIDPDVFLDQVRKRETKLMGFGHRVYKSYDPRAKILKEATDKVLKKLHINDPLLNIARKLEEVALADDFFKERGLYPNVDFYSGILLRALGIPLNMFTVMFAIGRMPGWIAHFKEVWDEDTRIYRPRQVYTGPTKRDYVPADKRG
ncbi:citrate synthase [Phycisphaerales bacterium AB-hyl4]|uniref:Citrate synthase n=1 Tax=Natronomicrosphaera hydrolytica TaxID=3242702 RepID=A0ABV4U9D7_9BACT